jgi:hypothetical protein
MTRAQQLPIAGHVPAGRAAHDFYPTPAWVVRALVESGEIPSGRVWDSWLDPCAGEGAIIRAVPEVAWSAMEIRPECEELLEDAAGVGNVVIGDFLTEGHPGDPSWVVTNPPFRLAADFARAGLEACSQGVAMLLPLGWLGSCSKRLDLLRSPPDVLVLSKRPSFTGRGTDVQSYAWCIWRRGQRRSHGAWRVLEVG